MGGWVCAYHSGFFPSGLAVVILPERVFLHFYFLSDLNLTAFFFLFAGFDGTGEREPTVS